MKSVLLMRHAKSSWANPGQDDHLRQLNGRGRRGAAALGHWVTDQDLVPDQVLCSDAARTQETWQRLALPGAAELDSVLYHAAPGALLRALRAATGDRVLVVGHNPGIAEAAERLAVTPPAHPRFAQYPTGATTCLEFDITDWADLDWGTGTVRTFVVPADLNVS